MMDRLNVIANDQLFDDSKIYAADPEIANIFSFEILNGSLKEFQEKEKRILLSSAVSILNCCRATRKILSLLPTRLY